MISRPHFYPSSPPDDPDTDVEIDVETVGVPVTLSPDVSLGATTNSDELNLASALPSSVYITAEMIDGDSRGSVTDFEVSVPTGLDSIFSSDSNVLLGDNLQVDLQTGSDSSSSCSGNTSGKMSYGGKVSSSSDSVRNLYNNNNNNNKSMTLVNEMSESEWPSGCSSINNSNKFRNKNNSSHWHHQHSISEFATQPSSKFITLDFANTPFPLAVSSLQLSASEDNINNSQQVQSNSSSTSSSRPNSSLSSSNCNVSSSASSSINTSSSSASSISICSSSTTTTTSLSNSLLSDRISKSISAASDKFSSGDGDESTPSSFYLRNQKDSVDSHSVRMEILSSNTKNNGSNVISTTTNNLNSTKLLTIRTNESLTNSDNNLSGAVISNGPSNSLQNSKCATKKDHYMFHES